MRYRVLGRTGIEVSEIGIGAWQLGGPLQLNGQEDGHPEMDVQDVIRLIHHMQDQGINLIDTAEQYGDGESERRVGQALKGRRQSWRISSKFGARRGPAGERINDCSPATIRKSLEASLQRLQTDWIDVYLYHVPPKNEWIQEGKDILERLKKAGHIRAYGISSNNIHSLKNLADADAVEVIQYSQSILSQQSELLELQKQKKWGGIVRGAYAGGRLCGKYFEVNPILNAQDSRKNWLKPNAFTKCKVFLKTVPANMTMAQMALRFLLDNPCTHSIILGAKSIEDYMQVLPVLDMPVLSESCKNEIEAARKIALQES